MATAKKNIYIGVDLEWAEKKLQEWRDYIDAHPFETLVDRMDYKETKNGGMIRTVVQTQEAIIKCIRDTMKDYLAMLEVVNKLREQEDKKLEARGSKELKGMMANKLQGGSE